jgi:hypothetical protein
VNVRIQLPMFLKEVKFPLLGGFDDPVISFQLAIPKPCIYISAWQALDVQ